MDNEIKKEIGKRLKEARERKKLSQVRFAEQIGVTQGAVAHWENGRRRIPSDKVADVATTLDMNISSLLGAEDVSSPSEVDTSDYKDLISKTLIVLRSKTYFSEALIQNIEAFFQAVTAEKTFENRLSALEYALKRLEHHPPPDFQKGNAVPSHQGNMARPSLPILKK